MHQRNLHCWTLAPNCLRHTLIGSLLPLKASTTPFILSLSLQKHQPCLSWCFESSKYLTCAFLDAFQRQRHYVCIASFLPYFPFWPLSNFFVPYLMFLAYKYIRRTVFLVLKLAKGKWQVATSFTTLKWVERILLLVFSHVNTSLKLSFLQFNH